MEKKWDICPHPSELEVNEPSGTEQRRMSSSSEENVEAASSLSMLSNMELSLARGVL